MRMYNFKAWAELPIVRNHKGEPLVRVRQMFTYRTILADRQKAMKRIQARKAKETAQATAQATKGKRASSTAAKPAPKKASRVNATPGPSRRPTRQRTTVPSDEDESDDNAAPATSTPRRSRRRTRKPSPHPPAEDESDDDAAHSRTAPTPGPSRRCARSLPRIHRVKTMTPMTPPTLPHRLQLPQPGALSLPCRRLASRRHHTWCLRHLNRHTSRAHHLLTSSKMIKTKRSWMPSWPLSRRSRLRLRLMRASPNSWRSLPHASVSSAWLISSGKSASWRPSWGGSDVSCASRRWTLYIITHYLRTSDFADFVHILTDYYMLIF